MFVILAPLMRSNQRGALPGISSLLAEIPITLRGLPEEFGVSHQSARRHFFSVARGSKVGGAGAHRPGSRPNDLPEW